METTAAAAAAASLHTLSAMSDHHHHRITAVELNKQPPLVGAPTIKTAAAGGGGGDSDQTDYSTSFADTTSTNTSNNSAAAASISDDAEVDSQFSTSFDDEFGTVFRFRKKRLTNHWRSFMRPLMWRCKWAELKIKQFESQALKYAKKIAAHSRTKHLATHQSIPEGFGSRSMPYTSQKRRRKLMKRRKRVRVEETADVDLYMSQHYLFSYHESKKPDPDELCIMDDFEDPEHFTSQETLALDMNSNSSFLEEEDNEMELILRKIDMAHSRVQKYKAQLDLVISENAQMFPLSENLNYLVPAEEQTSAVHSPTFSNSEFDLGGLGMSELAVSNYEEGFHIPDIIESTVGTLSSVDVTQHPPHIGDSCENILDNMLVHAQPAEAERHTLRSCQHQLTVQQEVKSEEDDEEEESMHLDPTIESDTATKDGNPHEQSNVQPSVVSDFQVPKNKRKRGERKAGPGKWNLQVPGEPET
uniref:uncharacterized protein LOC122581996 n=1 Tax=Erigeron canadensis TaxID=72917 RepID=UPI001CB93C6D|nr:uncharacterized protein LOC122581996 [Erigeron canadensis]